MNGIRMPKFLQYFVIRYRFESDTEDHIALVGMGVKRDVVYWGGTPSHYPVDSFKQIDIIRDYGWENLWPENFDVDVQYAKDFPPQPVNLEDFPRKDTEGLLAPDGTFYPCPYGGHTDLAVKLLRIMDKRVGWNAENTLLDLGYLSIHFAIICGSTDDDIPPTDAQIAWLTRAAELNDATYKKKVRQFFPYVENTRKRDTAMNLAKQRAIAMGAVRSQLRKDGIDPKTASYWQIETALESLRRLDSMLIVSLWYANASTHQWIMWKRDWNRWQKTQSKH